MIYIVRDEDGERIDRIARDLYGSEHGGSVELLLRANPGIARLGPVLPQGTVLTVPERPAKAETAELQPWE